jgi:hypothetical protein
LCFYSLATLFCKAMELLKQNWAVKTWHALIG